MASLNVNDLEFIKKSEVKEKLLNDCISKCRDYFLHYAQEIHRDYSCDLDSTHRIFVNFRIYDPIEPDDIVEYGNAVGKGENDAAKAYEYLHDILIIQKIG